MKAKILLVDDDSLVSTSVARLLEKNGYEVAVVNDGFLAIEQIKTQTFDLIICDIRMPGMNGLETVQKIREIQKNLGRKQMAEVFLTGYAERELENQANQLKVSHYLYKPFDIKELISIIEKFTSNE